MAHRDCDRYGTVHKTHVIHDAFGDVEYCWGDSTEALAKVARDTEYREAREKAKHNKRMAKLDKRERFGGPPYWMQGALMAVFYVGGGALAGWIAGVVLLGGTP